jgi:hypothetical protein
MPRINLLFLIIALLNTGLFLTYLAHYRAESRIGFRISSWNPLLFNAPNGKFLFCIILTTPKSLRTTRPYVVMTTWASKCSDYRFVTVLPEPLAVELAKFNITKTVKYKIIGEQINILQPHGWLNESYDNLTYKVLLAVRDIYSEHSDYKWYLKADDDTFIHNENFNHFFMQRDPNVAATYGFDFQHEIKNGYPSGGAGYVLSNRAFSLLGDALVRNASACGSESELSGAEDYDVAKCLRRLGVNPVSTSDQFGRARFNTFNLMDHYFGNYPAWFLNRTGSPKKV